MILIETTYRMLNGQQLRDIARDLICLGTRGAQQLHKVTRRARAHSEVELGLTE